MKFHDFLLKIMLKCAGIAFIDIEIRQLHPKAVSETTMRATCAHGISTTDNSIVLNDANSVHTK